MRFSSTAAMAFAASGLVRTNHCFETSGSTTVWQRWHLPRLRAWSSTRSSSAERFEIFDNPLAGFIAIEAGVLAGRSGHFCVLSDDLDQRQVVAFAGFEIVGIVRGRDLDGAGSELGVGHFVENDGDLAIRKRQGNGGQADSSARHSD